MAAKRIETYQDAFWLVRVPLNDTARQILKELEQQGHTEKSISFAIWRGQKNIIDYKGTSKFWEKFKTEILQWSWAKGDPRWDDYHRRKEAEEKLKRQQQMLLYQQGRLEEEIEKDLNLQHSAKRKGKLMPGFIYVIQGELGGPIKIGYSQDVAQRVKELQTGYPDDLKVLHMFPGNMDIEAKIHQDLKKYRMRGEWFKPDKYVMFRVQMYKKRMDELIKSGQYAKRRTREEVKQHILDNA